MVMASGNIVRCPKCQKEIGREYIVDDIAFFDTGELIVRRIEASCKQCGENIYWVVPDVKLQRLIKRVLEQRKKYE